MKLLKINDKRSNNRGNISHGAEKKHLKAISLIEELNARTRRQKSEGTSGRNNSVRQKALDPKRLLCFNNKSKKDQYQENGEPNRKRSPWISRSIVEYNTDRKSSFKDERRNTGNISDLCNELCQDYYEIRKKLKNRPIVLTPKKAQILDAIAGSNSTSSSVDAPLRNFNEECDSKRGKNCLHFSNGNRELHRRQRSLLDDNGSIHSENNKSKSNITNSEKSNKNRSDSHRSQSEKSRSSRSNTNKSKSQKSNRTRSNRVREEIAMSESTENSIPVSFVEKKAHHNGLQPDISMMSTISSSSYSTSSYSTCDESTVILSPRGANDKVNMPSKSSEKTKNSKMTLVCSSAACSGPQPKLRHQVSRNPISVGKAPSNLGTITEGDDCSSSSASSASSSSYGSSSSGSYTGSYYSHSGSDDEEDDPSVDYGSDRMRKTMLKTNANSGCNIASGGIWNAIMFDEGNNGIVDREVFLDEDRRDDL
jgi:hypothetical protein